MHACHHSHISVSATLNNYAALVRHFGYRVGVVTTHRWTNDGTSDAKLGTHRSRYLVVVGSGYWGIHMHTTPCHRIGPILVDRSSLNHGQHACST